MDFPSHDSRTKPEADKLTLEMSCDEGDSNCSVVSSNSDKKLCVKSKRGRKKGIIQKREIDLNDLNDFKDHVSEHKLENCGDEDVDWDEFNLALSDSDNSISHELQTDTEQKCKRKKPLGPLELHFKCEWKNCNYETENEAQFHIHVSFHIPHLEIKTLGNGEEVYKCLWAECTHLTGGSKEIQRHVTYHSYHTKLKNIGAEVIKQWNVQKCTLDNEMRNDIPENIGPMTCEWIGCTKENKEFNNVQVFFQHIQMHVNENFDHYEKTKEKVKCKWDGCKLSSGHTSKTALTNHVRTHSQEKVVGCPTCGHLFATNTKLIDHCERQLPNELAQYQCSQCFKHYPNLRLLKDHMRGHINFYKCCYCDMTSSSRHAFIAHIRYKHLESKPFKCNMCDYTCKTQQDLKLHLTSHDPNPQFHCEEAGCDFACRTKRTIQRHMIDEHAISSPPVYACHMPDCNKKFKRGCYLTKHLMKTHCLRWPSGHSKFIYSREEDRVHRLQTVRYESMKLYKESKSPALTPKSNFKVTPQPGEGSRSFEVSSVDLESESGTSQVFISIEDESGNTINSCTTTELVGDKIPKNATVIASADAKD